eukprot:gnl/TRDRNA2_/TRDRNA2_173010_c15_seq3.p2 gnl/TRDRNA2_/TRDRNA2_173010_c15~~gnl/TRDRNA2_/TRDRNA2_173010_c15_seq3.p2  ORF type:complete len:177 (+),score=11.49 gnl/TRDRNA2_/TRDRNA2_173010_c15_seq3:14-544(+)
MSRMTNYKPQELGNTAWAFATLSCHHHPLMHAIAEASRALISDFAPQNLANTAWAFADLRVLHTPLLSAIASESIRKIKSTKPQELAMMLWAFSRQGISLANAFALLRRADTSRLSIDALGLGAVLDGCERRGWTNGELRILPRLAFGGLSVAALNVAAMRAAEAGDVPRAMLLLR